MPSEYGNLPLESVKKMLCFSSEGKHISSITACKMLSNHSKLEASKIFGNDLILGLIR